MNFQAPNDQEFTTYRTNQWPQHKPGEVALLHPTLPLHNLKKKNQKHKLAMKIKKPKFEHSKFEF